MSPHGAPPGPDDGPATGPRRIVAVTALITGTLAAATGAGLGVRVLTSPPTLVTGIVQAVALLALVLGVLLLILGFALEGRDLPPGAGSTRPVRRATVGAIALIVAGAAVAGWSG